MPQSTVDERRTRPLNAAPPRLEGRVVLYWMSRDQRVEDNWALLYAQEWATDLKLPLQVVFGLTQTFLGATQRHYDFMLTGLAEVERKLREQGISFILLRDDPVEAVVRYAEREQAALLVTDFSPLRIGRQWRARVAADVGCAVYEVDAHNVIPAWRVSDKEEYGAYTLRPKVQRLLPQYLTDFPAVQRQAVEAVLPEATDWDGVRRWLKTDTSVGTVAEFTPGAGAAQAGLQRFLSERLDRYATDRNDPTLQGASDLSPYYHFGQLSPQRVAWAVQRQREQHAEGVAAYVEELVVRRELSDNYCLYQPQYDSVAGAKDWARQTLADHAGDKRPYLYTRAQLEAGETHDAAWNAAQMEMVRRGKMHNYMRMYWAKQILVWTETPERAYEEAIYLNDRYELDGRDPNGYTGVAWSIGGVHDRPWPERPILGKIRSMVYSGLAKKFDVKAYIKANPPLR